MNYPTFYYEPAASPAKRQQQTIAESASEGVVDGFKRITPALVLVAVATGASFAIGNWLAHRFILPRR